MLKQVLFSLSLALTTSVLHSAEAPQPEAIDATLGYLAKQETAFRTDPAQFKNAVAAKVFALGKK